MFLKTIPILALAAASAGAPAQQPASAPPPPASGLGYTVVKEGSGFLLRRWQTDQVEVNAPHQGAFGSGRSRRVTFLFQLGEDKCIDRRFACSACRDPHAEYDCTS